VAADLQTEHTVNKQRPFDGLEVVSSWAERHADHLCKVYLPDLFYACPDRQGRR